MEDSLVKTWEGLSVKQAQGCSWYAQWSTFRESCGLGCQKLWDCNTLSLWATLDTSQEPAMSVGMRLKASCGCWDCAVRVPLWSAVVYTAPGFTFLSTFHALVLLFSMALTHMLGTENRSFLDKSWLITDSWAGVAAEWLTAFALWAPQVRDDPCDVDELGKTWTWCLLLLLSLWLKLRPSLTV